MKQLLVIISVIFIAKVSIAQINLDYFGQTPPGDSAVIFAPGIVSLNNRFESGISFSPDGKECCFSTFDGINWSWASILYSKYENGSWSNFVPAPFIDSTRYFDIAPLYSNDGQKFLFSSARPSKQYQYVDLWICQREEEGWGKPVKLGNTINQTNEDESCCSISNNGNLYFNKDYTGDIWFSRYQDEAYTTAVKMDSPINSTSEDGGAFIAPDESYIIFSSSRPGGYGSNDLYISFFNKDSSWTEPKNLGDKINTVNKEGGANISPDGKYLFFSRSKVRDYSDIYWVSTSFIEKLRPDTTKELPGQTIHWTQKQSLPLTYRNGRAASCNGKVYFMGGYCNSTPDRFEKSNYEYDPAVDRWVRKKYIPTGRSNFAMAAIGDKIFAIGGDPFSPKNEVYNPAADTWETMQPMLTPRQHIGCAVVDGKIYIAGGVLDLGGPYTPSGWSYKNLTDKNEVYDPATDSWEEKAPMPTKRHGAFMAAVNGKIYVIGGMGDTNDIWKSLSVVEMYDPKTDKWETKTPLPEPRNGFGITVFDNKIYVIGGYGVSDIVNTVYVYDPKVDKWFTSTEFPNMQNAGAGCACLGNTIYIIAGNGKNYTANSNLFAGEILQEMNIDYLGQTPPGLTPEVFAPGILSVENKNSHALTISPDGSMIICSRYPDGTSVIVNKNNGEWSEPEPSFFYGKEVSFTPDGRKIFYYTEGDIFYVEKNGIDWSNPVHLGANINTSASEYYPCIVQSGAMYFSRDGNWATGRIMRSEYKDGEFQLPVDLGPLINTGGALHAYITPDENTVLFNSPRKGSFTQCDIWVSFKNDEGNWTEPQNLGEEINSGADAVLCPKLSPDGKYLFFTKLNFNTNTGLIYWVSAEIIDSIKEVLIDVKEENFKKNKSFRLNQNFPNPFNPSTTINYQLSEKSRVKLIIYDTLGKEIKTLVDTYKNAGEYSMSWNGKDNLNNPVSSGIYFYSLLTDKVNLQKKMLLLR